VPLYEYKCLKCGRNTEKIEPVSGPHLKKCPHCGGKVESVITAPAIQFKGSGWYVTDYAGKSTDGGSKENKPAADGKESGGKDTGGKETGSKDSKDGGSTEGAAKDSSAKESSSKESSSKEKKPAKKK
jgi:putative FmdB family regulatory protein